MKIKIIITLLISSLLFSCTKEKSELDGTWLLVEQVRKPKSKNVVYGLIGLLVCFEGNKVKYSMINSKEETKRSFTLDENQIIQVDTNSFGKIIHLSSDSLVIEEDTNSFDMHFVKLKDIQFSKSDRQDVYQKFISYPWEISTSNFVGNFYCDTTAWGGHSKDEYDLHSVVYEEEYTDWKGISDYDWWTLKHFDGKLIFSFSGFELPNHFFQITEIKTDSLKGQFINIFDNNWIQTEFIKKPILSKSELASIKEKVYGDWKVQTVIEPDLEKIDSIYKTSPLVGTHSSGSKQHYFSINNFEQKNIHYQFNKDETFKIEGGDKEIRAGKLWRLTNDGRFIKLGKGVEGMDFIRIISLTDDVLHIYKKDFLDYEIDGRLNFFEINLNLKLIKQ